MIFFILAFLVLIESRTLRSRESTSIPKSLLVDENFDRTKKMTLLLKLKEISDFDRKVGKIEEICSSTLGHYVGERTFTIKANFESIETLENLDFISSIGLFKPEHRYVKKDVLRMSEESTKREYEIYSILFEKSQETTSSSSYFSSSSYDDVVSSLQTLPFFEELHTVSISPSSNKMFVYTPKSYCSDVLSLLTSLEDIHFIHEFSFPELKNRDMKWITNRGIPNEYIPTKYTGAGEIIGIGDSGLDTQNCLFYDPDHDVPYISNPFSSSSSSSSSFSSLSSSSKDQQQQQQQQHRKIDQYWTLMDDLFEENSHGTHCSGSIAGNWRFGESVWNGYSYNSKLYFIDCGCITQEGCSCSDVIGCPCILYPNQICEYCENCIFPPLDLKYYFEPAYDRGVRLMSNSWGGDSTGYSMSTSEIDTFIWNHKDFLPVFAAGNAGDELLFSSLDNEGECKNCLTVGASENAFVNFEYIFNGLIDFDARRRSLLQEIYEFYECHDLTHSQYCFSSSSLNSTEVKEICEFVSEMILSDEDFCCDDGTQYSICASESEEECGCDLTAFGLSGVGSYCCQECALLEHQLTNASYPYMENMAYFSSMGPTLSDHRIKPDVVAPGAYIVSAKGNPWNVCNGTSAQEKDFLVQMQGTSMATPSVTGALGVLREYLVQTKGISNPSASLMKAFIINSAERIHGLAYIRGAYMFMDEQLWSDSNEHLDIRNIQGFGRIQLGNVLDSETIHYFDQDEIRHGNQHYYCFETKAASTIKATLVYTDYPSIPSRRIHLTNDLNLIIRYNRNEQDFIFGNAEEKNELRRDNVNNVEQIEITEIEENNRMVVIIEGYEVLMNPQTYSLVIRSDTPIELVECEKEEQSIDSLWGTSSSSNNSELIVATNLFAFFVLLFVNIIFIVCVCFCCCVGAMIVAFGVYFNYAKNQNKRRSFSKLVDDLELGEGSIMKEEERNGLEM